VTSDDIAAVGFNIVAVHDHDAVSFRKRVPALWGGLLPESSEWNRLSCSYPENRGRRFHRNVRAHLPNYWPITP